MGFPEVWSKDFGPWDIWSNSWVLWHGCQSLLRRLQAPETVTPTALLPTKQPFKCPTKCHATTALQYCRHLNGVPLCLTETDAIAADAQVWDTVQALSSHGLLCATDILQYYCAISIPTCSRQGIVTPVAYESCLSALTECGVALSGAETECSGVAVSPATLLQAPMPVSSGKAVNPIVPVESKCVTAPVDLKYCSAADGASVSVNLALFGSAQQADAFVGEMVAPLIAQGVGDACVNAVATATCGVILPQCGPDGQAMPLCQSTCVALLQSCATIEGAAESLCEQLASPTASCGYSAAAKGLVPASGSSSNGPSTVTILLYVGVGVVGVGVLAIAISVIRRARRRRVVGVHEPLLSTGTDV